MNPADLLATCAQRLSESVTQAQRLSAFVGLDGFVDEIIHVVDCREDAETFTRLSTIADLAERLAGAAGKSTNVELVNHLTKLGGNGPIMANALAAFGIRVSYLGNLGYPALHPVFVPFAERVEAASIAEPGHTDALEFDDGKVMFGKLTSLNEITWPAIQDRFGRDRFYEKFSSAQLVGFVNWTMIPQMSRIWDSLLKELCPLLTGPRRFIFFDLADPEKRSPEDILEAIQLISAFQQHFDVILGLNEKESDEVRQVLGLPPARGNPESLVALAIDLQAKLKIHTLAVHPVTYALAVSNGVADVVQGPWVSKPVITTGAGDHFNAGFCLGKLLGFDNALALTTGVASSGFYVRTASSPSIPDLARMLQDWPARQQAA